MNMNTNVNGMVGMLRKLGAAASVATWALRFPGVEEACGALGLLHLDDRCAEAKNGACLASEEAGCCCG